MGSATTTILFVLLGLFILRVVPTWINFKYKWVNILLKAICYAVGLFITIYFICSMLYNMPQTFNTMFL